MINVQAWSHIYLLSALTVTGLYIGGFVAFFAHHAFRKSMKRATELYLQTYAEEQGLIENDVSKLFEAMRALERGSIKEKALSDAFVTYVVSERVREALSHEKQLAFSPRLELHFAKTGPTAEWLHALEARENFLQRFELKRTLRDQALRWLVRAAWGIRSRKFVEQSSREFLDEVETVTRASTSIVAFY